MEKSLKMPRSLALCVCFVDRCLSFCTFSFGHGVVSVLLRYTDSEYPYGHDGKIEIISFVVKFRS
jgi:hypothetical protein